MPSTPLISVAELASLIGSPSLRIFDASWYLATQSRNGWSEFLAGHLPGARYLDLDLVSDQESSLPHMLPPAPHFERIMRAMGVRKGDFIVVYDGSGVNLSAPRIWWMLRAFGHDDVAVLDGGLATWRRAGLTLHIGEPDDVSYGNWEARPRGGFMRSLAEVRAIAERGDVQVVDARAAARFRGDEPEPRPGLRSGHIPGARNLPYTSLSQPDGRFVDTEAVRALLRQANVDPTAPIVTSCGSGVTACTVALALHMLGATDLSVYDGSWTEWGGRSDTPVETGG